MGLGVLLVLVAVLPGIGRPDAMVQSTDAVAHLNRIRRFLETDVFSSLGSPGQPAYPSAFHDIAGSLAQVVPALTDGQRHRRRGEPHGRRGGGGDLAARAWWRWCGSRSGARRCCSSRAGLVSAAFTSFPFILMGWGVLWPNLLGTALLPGVLGPALVAVGCVAPVPGLPRRLAVVVTLGAVPGLALAHPNALVSLVLFVVLAVGTRFALRVAPGRR